MEHLEIEKQDNHMPASLAISQSIVARCDESHSQNSSQLDQDKCYLMEIQQLKRENNFLKKKLAQYTKKQQRSSYSVPLNKRPSGNFGTASQLRLEERSENYILSFVDEVTKLLLNFSSLFNIVLQCNLQKEFQAQNNFFNEMTAQKTDQLNRRLARIFLEPEQNQFKSLLEIFQSYYRETTEHKRLLRQKVEQLTSCALEMGKKMATSVKQRQRGSIKGSRFSSTPNELFQSRQIKQQCLKSSIIKSTCTDEIYEVGSVRMSFGKEKVIYNLF